MLSLDKPELVDGWLLWLRLQREVQLVIFRAGLKNQLCFGWVLNPESNPLHDIFIDLILD